MRRLLLAIRSFFSILGTGTLPEDVLKTLRLKKDVPVAPPPPVASAADGALQILSILQRDARLIDFLMEDIGGYSDDQVGAAIRQLHGNCKEALVRHVPLAPVIDGVEGTLARPGDAGALSEDPNAVKFLGKVPPSGRADSGILRHRGWKAEKVSLPPLGRGCATQIVAPAELEIE